MWKHFIRNFSKGYVFHTPAGANKIEEVKGIFNIKLKDELQSLLEETDGVTNQYGCHLVWPTSRNIKGNLNVRSYEDFKDLYMPFDCLLFIADAGNSDLF